ARYYDRTWAPVYGSPSDVVVDRCVNVSARGAVIVVPSNEFGRVIDPTIVTHVDPQTIARVRPVLDPLTIDPLRAAAFQTRQARARFDVPREIEQRIANTPVVASTAPMAPPFRRDLARALRVEPLNDRVKKQTLQITDQRAAAQTTQQPNLAAEQARERQMADLARQAARGDRNARQQMQELRRQQSGQRTAQGATVQAQGQQVGQPSRQDQRQQQQAQREAARQQTIQSQQQQRAAAQQQAQSQREQRRQNQAQQAPVRHSQQQQVLRQPAPQQRREARPPQYQR